MYFYWLYINICDFNLCLFKNLARSRYTNRYKLKKQFKTSLKLKFNNDFETCKIVFILRNCFNIL